MAAKSISYYLAPGLLALGAVLAAVNWYLKPERGRVWMSAILFLGCTALVLLLASRRLRNAAARGLAGDSIRSGVVFAGLIMVSALSMKLAATLGVLHDPGLSDRTTMVMVGAFLVFTGNAMPKLLRPMPALPSDAAKVQAYQRVGGWTWVLTGLGFAIVWLMLPLALAEPVSMLVIVCGMLVTAAQLIRLRRVC